MEKETLNIQNCVQELHARRRFLMPATIGLFFCAIVFGGTGALVVSTFSSDETARIIFGIVLFSFVTIALLAFAIYQAVKSIRMKKWTEQGQFYIVEDRLIDFGYTHKYRMRKSVLDVSAKEIVEKSEDKPIQSRSQRYQTCQAGKHFIFEHHGEMYPNARNYEWSQLRSTNYQYDVFYGTEIGDIYYVLVFAKDKKHRPVQVFNKKFFQWKDPNYTVAPIQNEADE